MFNSLHLNVIKFKYLAGIIGGNFKRKCFVGIFRGMNQRKTCFFDRNFSDKMDLIDFKTAFGFSFRQKVDFFPP